MQVQMPFLMRRVLLLLLLALPFGSEAQQRVNMVDRIVAVVNKEVITYSELNKAIAGAERELRRQGAQAPEREVLERQMLERLILDKAQLQMARETGIRVDDLQLDRSGLPSRTR
jgi:peptidyl-prolyl cis-trans isomerase SurA